jgi:signal transduction histidine kinase/ligand-binding sensor domain-containing protein
MRRFYILVSVCLVGIGLLLIRAKGADFDPAESAGNMRTWHGPDVLPSDSVTAILQTRDGFLWVGTTAGLVWFDGIKFTKVALPTADPNSPVCITALCEDSDGYLWIGTQQNGLFEMAQGELHHYTAEQGLGDGNVTSLAADSHQQVWIGSKSGLELWTGSKFKSFTTRDGLSDDFVSGVNVARSGTVWITTLTGMCRFIDGRITPYVFQTESQGRSPEYLGTYEDRRGNLWAFGDTYLINLAEGKRFNYFRSSESASVRIWSLCEGQDGRIWIGTSGRGLFCFEDNRFQPVILGENRWSFDVRSICEDHEGDLWLGTSGGGLVQLRTQSVHVVPSGQGLPNSVPTALAIDQNGRVFVGLQRGGLFVGESGRFERVAGSDGLETPNFISSVSVGRDGVVWAGTLGDGLYGLKDGLEVHLTTQNGLTDNNILSTCVDSEGAIWAGTSAGTIHRFDSRGETRFSVAQGLPGTPVTVIIAAAGGGLWLGTEDGQVFREQNGKITSNDNFKNPGGFPVVALYEGEADRLWVGTTGGGLTCLSGDKAANWTTSNGLLDDSVYGVVEDQAKNLWLTTGTGIYRVNRSDVRKMLENQATPLAGRLVWGSKNLPPSGYSTGGIRAVSAPDGQLWFASSEGVLNADTHQSESENSSVPVRLVSAAVNGQPPFSLLRGMIWAQPDSNRRPFQTPTDLSSLEIQYTALDFAAPEGIKFRHKLDGSDSEWVDDGSGRSAHYGTLPHGRYRFHVAARYADGPWQEAAESFAFVVPTPFYLQTWVISLFGLAAVAIVAGIVRVISVRRLSFALARLEQQQTLERERMRIARDMHDEMGSKLTKISFLSEHARVDADATGPLADKIESIAQTSRELLQTMDEIVWVVNPHNDTLENLVAYLGHYAVEYFQNTQVECEIRLPPNIPHCPLSSEIRHNLFLTFEEALNNVLKHSQATQVKVEMAIQGRQYELRIIDNGCGFSLTAPAPAVPPRSGRGGNGLNNMRQRLAEIGGECLIDSRFGEGTTITIRVRLNQITQHKP